MTLDEMQKHYPKEEYCYALLEELRWNNQPTCSHCGSTDLDRVICNGYKSRCGYTCGSCSKEYSVTTRTVFHNTRIHLTKWFAAIHLIKTFRRLPEGWLIAKTIGVTLPTALKLRAKILADLESENSLCEQIYQYNLHLQSLGV